MCLKAKQNQQACEKFTYTNKSYSFWFQPSRTVKIIFYFICHFSCYLVFKCIFFLFYICKRKIQNLHSNIRERHTYIHTTHILVRHARAYCENLLSQKKKTKQKNRFFGFCKASSHQQNKRGVAAPSRQRRPSRIIIQ